MQSGNVTRGFANEIAQYPQLVVLMSDKVTIDNREGKFYIPIVNIDTNENDAPKNNTIPSSSRYNLINKDNLGSSKITTSNYIDLIVPKYLFSIKDIKIETKVSRSEGFYTSCKPTPKIIYDEYPKGTAFIAVFVSGNRQKPRIIGVY